MKTLISILLIFSSFLLIFYTLDERKKEAIKTQEIIESQKINYTDYQELSVDLSEVLRINNNSQYYLVFLLHTQICMTCLNEIVEYDQIVNEFIESDLNTINANAQVLIIADSLDNISGFAKSLETKMSVSKIHTDQDTIELLRDKQSNDIIHNQILFYSSKEKRIIARIKILNYPTEILHKKNLIHEAYFELENYKIKNEVLK